MEVVVIWFLFAIFSAVIANSKGRSGMWFFAGLFLGPFGLLVAALPSLKTPQAPAADARIPEAPVSGKNRQSETRSCPSCGEEILKIAKLCKHCKSSVTPLFVNDPKANQQIVLISELVRAGLSPQEIVVELEKRNVPCLGAAGRWDSAMVSGIIEDFGLTV